MTNHEKLNQLNQDGHVIVPNIYTALEVQNITTLIESKTSEGINFVKSKSLYAIRQLLIEIPELRSLLFNDNLKKLINELGSSRELFISKAIYFDKPAASNWFVAYHQDLTINVQEKINLPEFKNWTNKRGQIGVQPPLEYLERTNTLRIHLDDTDESNGALRVVPGSHLHGIIRNGQKTDKSKEIICSLKKGDVMIMKPLLLHASRRSSGTKNRRVIHLEFCDLDLPKGLQWKEKN